MTRQQLLEKYEALPSSARKEVDKLVNSLFKPATTRRPKKAKSAKSLTDEPAFGMWKDRKDMEESAEWVRKFRREHWNRQRG